MHHFKQHLLSCPPWHRHLSTFFQGEEYIKSLIANPELVDRLALSDDDKVSTFESMVFTVNLPRCCGKLGLYPEFVSIIALKIPSFQSFTSPYILPQNEITSSKVLFPEHLPLSRIQAGIKSGSFLQGTFRASRDNYLEATVFVQGEGEDSTEVRMCLCLDFLSLLSCRCVSISLENAQVEIPN